MRITNTMFAVVATLALMASPALAGGGFGTFGVGLTGAGTSFSGAGHLSGAAQFGSSTASSTGQSFGHAESGFGVGVGQLPANADGSPGAQASQAYGNFAGANVSSGSMSNASTTANGNGFAAAGSIGGGFGSTTLQGAGAGAFATSP